MNRGIVVTDDMRTTDPDIFSVGECVEHRGNVFGLVAPIWDQAKVCAARGWQGRRDGLVRQPGPFHQPEDHGRGCVLGRHALMAADEGDDEITLRDDNRGLYKKNRFAR